ncbi:MAG: NADH:ubiquinone oxidoreductase subunit M, partial [uncultured bacterium]
PYTTLFRSAFAIVAFSSIGLPGLNGFIGEFLILAGVFSKSWLSGALTASGVVIGAVYMLSAYEKIFLGSVAKKENSELADMTGAEKAGLAPLIILIFAIGIYPAFISSRIDATVKNIAAAPRHDIRQIRASRVNLNEDPVNAICQKKN